MVTQVSRRIFNVDEFDSMTAAGIFAEDDRLELIEGEIIEMSPIGTLHSGCVNRLNWELTAQSGGRWIVSVQNPIRLNDRNQPQPDLTLLKFREDFYSKEMPRPEDVLLLVEVSDTTLDYDREIKLPLYAKAGIPEVLIANLGSDRLLAFRDPVGDRYTTGLTLTRGEVFSSRTAGVTLDATSILG